MDTQSYLNEFNPQPAKPGAVTNAKVLTDGRRVKEHITNVGNDDGSREVTHELLEEVIPMRVAERIRRKFMEIPIEECHERIAEDGSVQTDIRKLENTSLEVPKPLDKLDELTNEVRALRQAIGGVSAPCEQPVEEEQAPEPPSGSTFLERASVLWGRRQSGGQTSTKTPGKSAPTKKLTPNLDEFEDDEGVLWARKSPALPKNNPAAKGKKIAPDLDEFEDDEGVLWARRTPTAGKTAPAAKGKKLAPDVPDVPDVVIQHDPSKVESALTTVAWMACAVAAGLATYSLL
jgi:hypothetical protein